MLAYRTYLKEWYSIEIYQREQDIFFRFKHIEVLENVLVFLPILEEL